ncbi:MAG: UbiX family flavin prenyltransferase [Bacteroidales bacterium]|jgi:4-hydroxy-3-polyprenylbenzoate decarboxylase|nr:UbiX family flavin prenyltransferase [Bacteroidales bacterium]
MSKRKIVVAITGASGSVYAQNLIHKLSNLKEQIQDVGIVFSDTGKTVYEFELEKDIESDIPFKIYKPNDFFAPFASGSAQYDTMVIIPCSMGTMGKIANGIADDLISRAADVMLKERRKLILVTRDTPLNLIQIRNMEQITLAGGVICPASPSFYKKPETITELVSTVTDRVLDLCNLEIDTYRWNDK